MASVPAFEDWLDLNLPQLVELSVIPKAKEIMIGSGFSQATIDAIEYVKTGKNSGYVTWRPTNEDGQLFGPFVEKDTKPHEIVGKPYLSFFWKGAKRVFRKVNHPGTRGQHIMERAEEEGLLLLSELIIAKANEDFGSA